MSAYGLSFGVIRATGIATETAQPWRYPETKVFDPQGYYAAQRRNRSRHDRHLGGLGTQTVTAHAGSYGSQGSWAPRIIVPLEQNHPPVPLTQAILASGTCRGPHSPRS